MNACLISDFSDEDDDDIMEQEIRIRKQQLEKGEYM